MIPIATTPEADGIGVQMIAAHGCDRNLLDLAAQHSALRGFEPAPLARMESTA